MTDPVFSSRPKGNVTEPSSGNAPDPSNYWSVLFQGMRDTFHPSEKWLDELLDRIEGMP